MLGSLRESVAFSGWEALVKLNVLSAIVMFVLGGLAGHVVTLPSVNAETSVVQISPSELTVKAGQLPVQAFDAI